MIPAPLRSEIEQALASRFGGSVRLKDEQSLGGGCISNATRIETSAGARAFLKWGRRAEFSRGLFVCEATSLTALSAAAAVRVPQVIAVRDEAEAEFAWLLLEWLEPGRASSDSWDGLGVNLARLHRVQSDRFGWQQANFIGSLPQSNAWSDSWVEFWRERRIMPQLAQATDAGLLSGAERRRIERLAAALDELAAPGAQDGASLLHGDLWGGNVHALASGAVALIDPSSYYGHREVDLAMARLFGGFNSRFFAAYHEAWPLQPGHEQRRDLYQLYYMLVHVNLFGGSYVSATMALVGRLGF